MDLGDPVFLPLQGFQVLQVFQVVPSYLILHEVQPRHEHLLDP